MSNKKKLTREEILSYEDYANRRSARKADIAKIKKTRRMEVGPHATFYFENYETMWHQVHEMLYIERGGEKQIVEELEAYNPLIPQGRELVATVMLEIGDSVRRGRVLQTLGGIEKTMYLSVNGQKIKGVPEGDVERTNSMGKASSVQFIHFPFSDEQTEAFCNISKTADVIVGSEHLNYCHGAGMPPAVRKALVSDFD